MKLRDLLPPSLALIAGAIWLGVQSHGLSELRSETLDLRQRLASSGKGVSRISANRDEKDFGHLLITSKFTPHDQVQLRKAIVEMDRDQLLAVLDQIEALSDNSQALDALLPYLAVALAGKDPQVAVERLVGYYAAGRDKLELPICEALSDWAKRDPAAATHWLDQLAATGAIDKRTTGNLFGCRPILEGALIARLVGANTESAARRLEGLPLAQKQMTFLSASTRLDVSDAAAYAELVRSQSDEVNPTWVFSRQAEELAKQSGYAGVGDYFSRISPTAAEYETMITAAGIQKLRPGVYEPVIQIPAIDTFREWSDTQSPSSTDRATGLMLAHMIEGNIPVAQGIELALHYHETTGNDDVLIGFIQGGFVRQRREQARELAQKISDPTRRDAILKSIK